MHTTNMVGIDAGAEGGSGSNRGIEITDDTSSRPHKVITPRTETFDGPIAGIPFRYDIRTIGLVFTDFHLTAEDLARVDPDIAMKIYFPNQTDRTPGHEHDYRAQLIFGPNAPKVVRRDSMERLFRELFLTMRNEQTRLGGNQQLNLQLQLDQQGTQLLSTAKPTVGMLGFYLSQNRFEQSLKPLTSTMGEFRGHGIRIDPDSEDFFARVTGRQPGELLDINYHFGPSQGSGTPPHVIQP